VERYWKIWFYLTLGQTPFQLLMGEAEFEEYLDVASYLKGAKNKILKA
jgi:hypothetical protein